jgi:hypothetical protein
MQYNLLGKTGLRVSRLSFGASSLSAVFHPVDETEAMEAHGLKRFWVKLCAGSRGIAIFFRRKSANTQTRTIMERTRWIIRELASELRWMRAPRDSESNTSTLFTSTILSTRTESTRNGL